MKVQIEEGLDIEGLRSPEPGNYNIDTRAQKFLILKLRFKEDHCVIQTKDDCTFGLLNNKVFRCLSNLASFQDLEYAALMEWSIWQERTLPAGKNSKRMCIDLDINISGPWSKLDDTARGLSQAELFLQPPCHGSSDLPYENPQYLQIPGMVQTVEASAFGGSQVTLAENDIGLGENQALLWVDGYPDFDELLDDLPQHEYLNEAAIDIRVTTSLLKYLFLKS